MIEEYERLLDCKNYLRENLNVFIDAFVKFYGEDSRKEIEEKFSKAIFFAYREPRTTVHYLSRVYEVTTKELFQQKMEELDFFFLDEKDLIGNYSFEYENLLPIYSFKEFLKIYEKSPEEREKDYIDESYENIKRFIPTLTKEEFISIIRTQKIPTKYNNINKIARNNIEYYMDLSNIDKKLNRYFNECKELLDKIAPGITIDNFSYYADGRDFISLIELAHNYDEILNRYKSKIIKYKKYQEEVEIGEKINQAIESKYHLLLIDENKELLTQEELKIFEEVKKDPTKSYLFSERMRKLFGYGIKSNHAFDSFTENAEKQLYDPNSSTWIKDNIKRERLEYFKSCGIDYGEDYESLISDPEVKQLWPKKAQVEKYIKGRDKLINEYNIEYFEKKPAFIEMRKEIDALNLLDKDDPVNASLYTGNQAKTMVAPNIIKTKDGYDLFSLIMINCNHNDGTIDHNIVHELNHQFELFLKSVKEDEYEVLCGWDVLEGDINQTEKRDVNTLEEDTDKRPYELMNEIVNELIAQDICGLLDKHVFDRQDNSKTKHVTSYENTFYIIKEFYNTFKKEILESRKNGNIEIIWNKVGKENFDALNELFNIHYENFSGFRYLSLVTDLNEGKETSRTKIYHDIIEKRDKILEQMQKYSMQKEQEEKDKKKEQKGKKHGAKK